MEERNEREGERYSEHRRIDQRGAHTRQHETANLARGDSKGRKKGGARQTRDVEKNGGKDRKRRAREA